MYLCEEEVEKNRTGLLKTEEAERVCSIYMGLSCISPWVKTLCLRWGQPRSESLGIVGSKVAEDGASRICQGTLIGVDEWQVQSSAHSLSLSPRGPQPCGATPLRANRFERGFVDVLNICSLLCT